MNVFLNTPLIAAIVSWVSAQIIKTIAYIIKHKTFNPERILGPGGMPSSHSATVTSLAIVIFRVHGIASTEFALAMVLALVVMYDATGVRRAAGLHAREINRLNRVISEYEDEFEKLGGDEKTLLSISEQSELNELDMLDDKDTDLKEILGHTPLEVLVGAVLGAVIGIIFSV